MPWSAPKPCNKQGCPRLTRGRYCEEHLSAARKASDAERKGERHLHGGGSNPAWRALRAKVLQRDPICRDCGHQPSTTAAHIVDKRDGGLDRLDNLKGKCKTCHDKETAHARIQRQRRGGGSNVGGR